MKFNTLPTIEKLEDTILTTIAWMFVVLFVLFMAAVTAATWQ
jgi:hypothetical protein